MILHLLNKISRSPLTKSLRNTFRSNTDILPFVYFPCLITTCYLLLLNPVSYWWFLLSFFMYFLTGCIGITVTFHRYLAHHSYESPKWFQIFGSICGSLGGTGSPIGWRGVHIEHHKYSDHQGDPHSPVTRGWRLFLTSYPFNLNKFAIRNMITDPFQRFMHEYYILILLLWGILLLSISVNVFLFAFIVPIAIQITFSNISNYYNHHYHWGCYRTHQTNDESYNSTWLGLLTWGEGLGHNKHHAEPWNPNYGGNRWWEIDPSFWIIQLVRTDK